MSDPEHELDMRVFLGLQNDTDPQEDHDDADLQEDQDDLDRQEDQDGLDRQEDGGGGAVSDVLDPVGALNELPEIPPSMIELDKIPRRLWEQTLAPLHVQQRYFVAYRIADRRLQSVACNLARKLDMDDVQRRHARDAARHEARRSGYPLPTPGTSHAVTRRTVQVNIRLRADDHTRLAQAAAAVGLRPTTLARALVLNGAGRILREHAA